MHIVWLKTELLHPVDRGGRIRTYGMLKELRARHRVTYIALDDGAYPEAAALATEYCHDLVTVPHHFPKRRSLAFAVRAAANVPSGTAFTMERFRSPAMRQAIRDVVATGDVDVVVCDFLFPAINLPADLAVPTVLFQHNVEAMIWQRHANVAADPLRRWYFAREASRLAAAEAAACRQVDRVVAVSAADATALREAYGLAEVDAVPTGTDTAYFAPTPWAARAPAELVFTGAMDWLPNEDGAAWFLDEVLPRLRAQVPGARVTLVGRNPLPALVERAARLEGVTVTGTVLDVRPYLARAALFIVPLRIGGGTRLKIYEAMAAGCPVVSTPIGAEGLPLTDGEHIALAEGAEAFAARCAALLTDEAARRALAERGTAYVRANFGWGRIAEEFAGFCERARSAHRTTVARSAA